MRGDVGGYLAKNLRAEGHQLTVIDKDGERLATLETQADLHTINGNSANLMILEEAHVGQADLVLCVTGQDEVNMLSCILARGLGAKHVIVRVKNQEYLAGRRYFYRKLLGCDFFR